MVAHPVISRTLCCFPLMLFAGCKCRALIGRKKNALPSKLIFYKAVPDPNLEIRGGRRSFRPLDKWGRPVTEKKKFFFGPSVLSVVYK